MNRLPAKYATLLRNRNLTGSGAVGRVDQGETLGPHLLQHRPTD